jgi:hypothetical protein
MKQQLLIEFTLRTYVVLISAGHFELQLRTCELKSEIFCKSACIFMFLRISFVRDDIYHSTLDTGSNKSIRDATKTVCCRRKSLTVER